jgi:hypothetical protein
MRPHSSYQLNNKTMPEGEPTMFGVYLILGTVAVLTAGYSLVWVLCPTLRAWMESPRDHFLEQQRRFPQVTRSDATRTGVPAAPTVSEDALV